MQKPKVFVGISMHPDAMRCLEEQAEVDVFPWDTPHEQLLPRMGDYAALIVYNPDQYAGLLAAAHRLQVISCHACSPDVLKTAARLGIRVTLTPTLWDTVADMTLALMFAAARNTSQADAAIRSGQWGKADLKVRFSGLDIFGKTLGILGLGRIGQILAGRVRGFDMKVLYTDLERKPALEKELGIEFCDLTRLLAESDILAVLVPLNDQTRGLLGEAELRSMKRDAILVNTARGAIIDPRALVRALQERWIAAAGLDVFVEEPLPPGHPLLSLDNVILAPHLGGSTKECDLALVTDALRVLNGQEPIHPA